MDEFLNINFIVELPNFDGYFIDMLGNVYSEKKGCMTKLKMKNRNNYYAVDLYKNKKAYTKSVHRLVAETFLDNPENKCMVDHINRNKIDNRLCNLRWVTSSENNKNYPTPITNTSGFKGVFFDRYCWRTQWRNFNGKRFTKCFNVNKYGDEEAKKLAIEHRQKMEKLFYPTLTKI